MGAGSGFLGPRYERKSWILDVPDTFAAPMLTKDASTSGKPRSDLVWLSRLVTSDVEYERRDMVLRVLTCASGKLQFHGQYLARGGKVKVWELATANMYTISNSGDNYGNNVGERDS